ncbi:MAG: NAD(P)/FAD-dependent oxidoreductase, partial [Bacteroidales bacterium]|nr:NAD(P)/FAD-dependent oxidoreductase [Bacteroidales bacterium]
MPERNNINNSCSTCGGRDSIPSQCDVAIAGGGLGGLQCGYILAKNGLNVCIVEKNPILGGCLQSYRRRGAEGSLEFDAGMHYVGGLDQGQPLNTLFKYFGLLNLPWVKMDPEAFDEVNINGRSYMFANGHNAFVEKMSEYFPAQKENLKKYAAFLKEVGESLPRSLSPKAAEDVFTGSLFARSAQEFLQETITDPLLREVLSGTSLKMELGANLPLYTFAQINNSFIESAYRLQGGGNLIAEALAAGIKAMGGTILTGCEVTEILPDGLYLANGEHIAAKHIISNLHPATTINLVGEGAGLRKVYRNRINRLENTFGMFTANIALKPGMVPHLNRNQYVYSLEEGQSMWDPFCGKGDDVSRVLVSYYNPAGANAPTGGNASGYGQAGCGISNPLQGNALALDLLTPMNWEEVEQFEASSVGHRPAEYTALKEEKLRGCIKLASTVIPGLEDAIERVYTSTPLTYRTYTATAGGCAYGIRTDCNNHMQTLLTPKSPLDNRYLTGQSLNRHGVLGVSMT